MSYGGKAGDPEVGIQFCLVSGGGLKMYVFAAKTNIFRPPPIWKMSYGGKAGDPEIGIQFCLVWGEVA